MKIIVDRIEENKAIVELESGKMLTVPKELFGDISEGDAITISIEKSASSNTDTHSIFDRLRNKSKKEG